MTRKGQDVLARAPDLLTESQESSLFVGSFEKALRVLAAFSRDRPQMGLRDLVDTTGLDQSSVPLLYEADKLCGESLYLTELVGTELVYVARTSGHHLRNLTPHTEADPARLVAQLDLIARKGYTLAEEQCFVRRGADLRRGGSPDRVVERVRPILSLDRQAGRDEIGTVPAGNGDADVPAIRRCAGSAIVYRDHSGLHQAAQTGLG